jgi:multidrug resistance efflux pump
VRPIAILWVLAFPCAWAHADGIDAEVVPRDFHPVVAPENTLRLPHWGSESNGIQLIELAEEGRKVAVGDVVATFKFDMSEARDYLDRRLMQLEAERREAILDLSRQVDQLTQGVTQSTIELEKLALDLLKKNTLSRVKQILLDFDVLLKKKELESKRRKLASARAKLEWTGSFHERQIETWKIHLRVYERTRDRYEVRAPAAGRVHYPTMESKNRKVRVADDMNSGVHFLSIITSDRARLEFAIPEPMRSRIAIGRALRVSGDGTAGRRAVVGEIDLFPMHVGHARRNFLLPDAWDKCFVVRADLADGFTSFPSKVVRVEIEP